MKSIFKNICFLLVLLTSISLMGQEDKPSLEYKVIKNNPEMRLFNIDLEIMSIKAGPSNTSPNIGIGGTVLWDNLYLNADANLYYIDNMNTLGSTITDPRAFSSASSNFGLRNELLITGSYSLFSKIKNEDLKVVVKSEMTSHDVRTNYYIPVPSKVKTSYMLDLGYNIGNTNFNFRNSEVQAKSEISGEVETFTPENGISTVYDYGIANIGVSRLVQNDIRINVDGFGEKSKRDASRIYFNALILTNISVDNLLLEFREPDTGAFSEADGYFRYSLEDQLSFNRLGFKVGYENISTSKYGFIVKLETGMNPGIRTKLQDNFFVKLGIGFALGKDIK